jgi:hypothetical protein
MSMQPSIAPKRRRMALGQLLINGEWREALSQSRLPF